MVLSEIGDAYVTAAEEYQQQLNDQVSHFVYNFISCCLSVNNQWINGDNESLSIYEHHIECNQQCKFGDTILV